MIEYQRGDVNAMVVLVGELSPRLYRFFVSHIGDRTAAEEMLRDAWPRIQRARHAYRPGQPLLPWIYAIARRVRVDNDRRNRRSASRDGDAGEESTRLPTFEALVASLPESQREILTLLKLNGLSMEDVARATSSTVGAVRQKAQRACERLRRLGEAASRR